MKFATLVVAAGCWAFVAGCGSNTGSTGEVNPAVKDFPKMGKALQKSPELQIKKLETPQQQAEFLRNLGKDSSFDPKLHTSFLETYSKNADPDVASAAKDLLDRTK